MLRNCLSAAHFSLSLLIAATLAACGSPTNQRAPLVLAASSLQEALSAVADAWTADGHARPVIAFAASSSLARQIENGAPADIFLSADESWMDVVEAKNLLKSGTRSDLLTNELVLIAPKTSAAKVSFTESDNLSAALGKRRLAIADPDAVPAGRYAKTALQHLGVWDSIKERLAPAENVRAALALVERDAAPFGIVYSTDAMASNKVRVVATFPEHSHPPIRYPVAVLRTATHADTDGFRAYLASPHARRIFARYGFATLP